MGDTNAIPTGVWIRAELVDALRQAMDGRRQEDFFDYHTGHELWDAARAVVDSVEEEGDD